MKRIASNARPATYVIRARLSAVLEAYRYGRHIVIEYGGHGLRPKAQRAIVGAPGSARVEDGSLSASTVECYRRRVGKMAAAAKRRGLRTADTLP